MLEVFRVFWRSRVTGTFLAGLLVLLPVVLTVVIIAWIVQLLRDALGPGTFLGDLLTRGGGTIIGSNNALAFWLGLLIALVGIWFLGAIVRTEARRSVQAWIDRLFTSMPFVKGIYSPVSRVVRLATEKGSSDLTGMRVVSLRLGGAAGADILALLASDRSYLVAGERRVLVYLPTAPLPMTGGLVMVPEESITVIPEMKVDDLLKVYFSLGALAPESLPASMLLARKQDAPPIESAASQSKDGTGARG